jgi:hypothetical protein
MRMPIASTAFWIGGGVAAGLLLSLILNRVVMDWAGIDSHSPALAACVLPARRASGLDPMIALRQD